MFSIKNVFLSFKHLTYTVHGCLSLLSSDTHEPTQNKPRHLVKNQQGSSKSDTAAGAIEYRRRVFSYYKCRVSSKHFPQLDTRWRPRAVKISRSWGTEHKPKGFGLQSTICLDC